MNLERFYEILEKLNMVDDEYTKPKEVLDIMNFVSDLTTFNDGETIRRLLVALISEMVCDDSGK